MDDFEKWLDKEIKDTLGDYSPAKGSIRDTHAHALKNALSKYRELKAQNLAAPASLQKEMLSLARYSHPKHGGNFLYAPDVMEIVNRYEARKEVVLGYGKHGGEWVIKWPREDVSGKTGKLVFIESDAMPPDTAMLTDGKDGVIIRMEGK